MSNSAPYTPLWCKSHYSFLEGASHPEELVETARALGLPTLALTDRDGVYGIPKAYSKARELGVKLITGAEMTVDGISGAIVLLSEDRRGYANLCRLISQGRRRSPKGSSNVTWPEVCEHAEGLVALLPAIPPGEHCQPLTDVFAKRLYMLLPRHLDASESVRERHMRNWASQWRIPLAAAVEVLYHCQSRQRLQDVLTCIRRGVKIQDAGNLLRSNAEHDLKSPEAFTRLFQDDLLAVEHTREIAMRCAFSMSSLRYRYPAEWLPDGTRSDEYLQQLTYEGARERYPDGIPEDVRTQLEKELRLIISLDYPGYFLTLKGVVEFCRKKQILCQGRGSAANSAVCYCLGITAVDPVRMGLLFERFLSQERAEPPDIDIDIQHDRREEVITWMYENYGRERAAMVANVIRYRARSALRDVGKVFGLDDLRLTELSKFLTHGRKASGELLESAQPESSPYTARMIVEIMHEIADFPRHLSIHPGGFLLGHEPVHDLVPIENATMENRTVIQWDKDDIETMGLFKVDLLGLGALTLVDKCLKLLSSHRGLQHTLATLPAEDGPTYKMIQQADTIGVFQIESRAQMSMLPRLRPKNFYDLVVEVAIVRPGPISGGMVHPYLRRRNGEEQPEYPHENLRPVLEKTLGVPLFQEQVMKLAIVAADYTPGEADQLRRDMAAWRRSGKILEHRSRLIGRMVKKGIAQEFAERVFEQIKGFGEYGFPESHAASFALIAYATSYLKCHFPTEFACALLNSQPMGFYAPSTIIEDAKRHGAGVLPVDVCHSEWGCTLEPVQNARYPFSLRMGVRYIKGLSENTWNAIQKIRNDRPFASLSDFSFRTKVDARGLEILAEAGALKSLWDNRRETLWMSADLAASARNSLALPPAVDHPAFMPLNSSEEITWDYVRTNHSARGHPLGPLREILVKHGLMDSQKINSQKNGSHVRYAGMVTCRQRPGTSRGVVFMTLEDEAGQVNVILWPDIFKNYEVIARTQSFVGVSGTLQSEQGVTHLIAKRLWIPKVIPAPADIESHDFH